MKDMAAGFPLMRSTTVLLTVSADSTAARHPNNEVAVEHNHSRSTAITPYEDVLSAKLAASCGLDGGATPSRIAARVREGTGIVSTVSTVTTDPFEGLIGNKAAPQPRRARSPPFARLSAARPAGLRRRLRARRFRRRSGGLPELAGERPPRSAESAARGHADPHRPGAQTCGATSSCRVSGQSARALSSRTPRRSRRRARAAERRAPWWCSSAHSRARRLLATGALALRGHPLPLRRPPRWPRRSSSAGPRGSRWPARAAATRARARVAGRRRGARAAATGGLCERALRSGRSRPRGWRSLQRARRRGARGPPRRRPQRSRGWAGVSLRAEASAATRGRGAGQRARAAEVEEARAAVETLVAADAPSERGAEFWTLGPPRAAWVKDAANGQRSTLPRAPSRPHAGARSS